MRLDQHHHYMEEQCRQDTTMARTSTSTVVSVSWVAFTLTVIASLSLFSSFTMAVLASLTFPSTVSVEFIVVFCSFVMSKKALFVLSNIVFLFLAADCRFFFCICSMSPSTGDATDCDNRNGVLAKQAQYPKHEISMVESSVVQPLFCCSGSHCNSRNEQGKYEHVMASPQSFGLEEEGEEENNVTLKAIAVEEPTCAAAQELEKLQIDELNRKFEEFIRSRKLKWQQEEEMECDRSNLSEQLK